jgi:hypothetical protein
MSLVLVAGCGSGGKNAEAAAGAAGAMNTETSGVGGSSGASDAEPRDGAILLTLEGEAAQLEGGARIEVREENPVVNLVVTAVYADNHDDLLQLQLAIDGVDQVAGHHTYDLAGASSRAYAVAYLDRVSYFSETGTLDLTVQGDGALSGSFSASLAPDAADAADAAPLELSGSFTGSWSLLCRSPVAILPGDHSVSDSAYCNNLRF